MTIRPVFIEGALTLEQWKALDPTGNGTGPDRPLCDGPIGSASVARRATDEAASRAFDEPDRPAVSSRRRPVGPRGHLQDGEIVRQRRIAGEAPVSRSQPRKPRTGTNTTPPRENAT